MKSQDLNNQRLELFDVEELEGRFEMKPWIQYVPCECPEEESEDSEENT